MKSQGRNRSGNAATKGKKSLLFISTALALCLYAGDHEVRAADRESRAAVAYRLEIPAQQLADSLRALGSIAGVNVAFPPEFVAQKQAPPIRGTLSIEEAFRQLLRGTGLSAHVSGRGYIIGREEASLAQPVIMVAAANSAAPAQAAAAAPAPLAASAAASSVEEVVVTGSRVVREGYEAPTPVSVVGVEQLEGLANGNIASFLATIPAFSGNHAPNGGLNSSNSNGGTTGLNLVNLRGLGTGRSLVLIDGQRFIPTLAFGNTSTYATDISGIPQQLVTRVDIVTGGASAVYGSDAVGGVTNFILDKDFTGVKGDVSGGITGYGDDENFKVELSGGIPFASGRGHALLSVEVFAKGDLASIANRDWQRESYCQMLNPLYTATNGLPNRITVKDCGATSAPGGLITSGPLKGTAFGAGGTPFPFTYGSLVTAPLMSGGDWRLTAQLSGPRGSSTSPGEKRQNFFGRVSYDITDSITARYTYQWAHTHSYNRATLQYEDGPGLTIQTDNAFIPAELRGRLAGTTSFVLSTMNIDLPNIAVNNERYVMRNVLSFDGKFDAFDTQWSWDAYYQHGQSRNSLGVFSRVRPKYLAAVDSIRLADGRIVCRINTDANTANDDPLCKPYNAFGVGVNASDAINYVVGEGIAHQTNTQQVWAVSTSGSPFELWAGPVSIAISAEHRRDSVRATADARALANEYQNGNYKPLSGKLNVTEGALESVIPLAQGESWSDMWDLQLAARFTGYSTSGFVTTWKVGSTYQISDVKLRGNISRDIRAPHLAELFATTTGANFRPGFVDLFTNTATFSPRVSGNSGNPNLVPEKADSLGIGVVYQPSFISGLTMSVDYWRVNLKDAIQALSAEDAIQICFQQNLVGSACPYITRLAGAPTIPGVGPYAGQLFTGLAAVSTGFVNIASSKTHGLDIVATYRFALDSLFSDAPGNVTMHWDQTYYMRGTSITGTPGSAPSYTHSYWRAAASISYDHDAWSVGLRARMFSKYADTATSDPQRIECMSGCPALSTLPANVLTQNYILRSAYAFLDANIAYKFTVAGAKSEAYINVRNLLNRDPNRNPVALQPHSFAQSGGGDNSLGQTFRLGVRFTM